MYVNNKLFNIHTIMSIHEYHSCKLNRSQLTPDFRVLMDLTVNIAKICGH